METGIENIKSLTRSQLAYVLGTPESQISRIEHAGGGIKHATLDGRFLYDPEDVRAWISKQTGVALKLAERDNDSRLKRLDSTIDTL